jgi:hypothetical protein
MAGKWWRRAALALLLAGSAWAGLWYAATLLMAARLEDWAATRRAEGWRVEHAPAARTGLPWSPALRLDGFLVETPAGLGWQAERVAIRLGATALHVVPSGAQALRLPGGAAPLEALGVSLAAPLAGGPARLTATRLAATGFALEGLAGTVAGGALDLTATRLAIGTLPPFGEAALAARIAPLPETTAAAWRAAGGRAEIERLELRRGSAALRATGRLGLDAALQPEGTATLTLTDAPAALTLLTEAGWLAPGVAAGLRAVAMLAARPDPAGGPPRLELPLELRNRRLGTSRLPLLTLPPIDWR